MASLRWIMQLHKDVPRAARFYSQGLDFSINVCTIRWAQLQSGSLKLALMQSNRKDILPSKLMALGAELDGAIKYEIHGKVAAVRCMDGHMIGLYEPA
ncbi:hypothetical protein ACHQM5_018013 [Ranunculus cassubicifolius]